MDKAWELPPIDKARFIAAEAILERVRRETAVEKKEEHKRLTAKAIAEGFSSLEEQEEHEMKEWGRRDAEYRKRLPEMAAAAGKTVEEYHRELYSNKDFIPPTPVLSFSQCDCEGKQNLLG